MTILCYYHDRQHCAEQQDNEHHYDTGSQHLQNEQQQQTDVFRTPGSQQPIPMSSTPQRPRNHHQQQQLKRIAQYEDVLAKARLRTTTFAPSVKYRLRDIPTPHPVSVRHVPTVSVVNRDVIDTILALPLVPTKPPLVLNLASYQEFGGGVARGAIAQEEELFRKTDYGCHRGRELYPLNKDEFVFTPGVAVLKTGSYQDLPPERVRLVDMIAVSALRLPEDQKTFTAKETQVTLAKIETLLYFAAAYGYRQLVLGALGCGAYHNPPQVVARLFFQALQKFGHYFDTVVFAVYARGDNPNFAIFHRVLLGRDPPAAVTAATTEHEPS